MVAFVERDALAAGRMADDGAAELGASAGRRQGAHGFGAAVNADRGHLRSSVAGRDEPPQPVCVARIQFNWPLFGRGAKTVARPPDSRNLRTSS